MTGQDIINRVRANPLEPNFDPNSLSTYTTWTAADYAQYLNEALNEFCKETLCLTDSDTPGICIKYVGINGANFLPGTNAGTVAIAQPIQFWNKGKYYTFPVTDNISMLPGWITPYKGDGSFQGDGSIVGDGGIPAGLIPADRLTQQKSMYCLYLLSTNGNTVNGFFPLHVTKGADVSTAAATVAPDTPSGDTPIGLFLIATDANHTYSPGVDSFDLQGATGVTIAFVTSSTTLSIDPRVIRVTQGQCDNQYDPISVRDIYFMNNAVYGWRNSTTQGNPRFLVQGNDTDKLQVWPTPKYPDRLVLTVKRRPVVPFTTSNMTNNVEIREQYHERLFNGVITRAFQKPGTDTFNAEKALGYADNWQADIKRTKKEELKMSQNHEANYLPGAFI